jgi:hypothetical protein
MEAMSMAIDLTGFYCGIILEVFLLQEDEYKILLEDGSGFFLLE